MKIDMKIYIYILGTRYFVLVDATSGAQQVHLTFPALLQDVFNGNTSFIVFREMSVTPICYTIQQCNTDKLYNELTRCDTCLKVLRMKPYGPRK